MNKDIENEDELDNLRQLKSFGKFIDETVSE